MFFIDETTADMTLRQGDSGYIIVSDLPVDSDYTLYFAFYNQNRVIIGDEVSVQSNGSSVVNLQIPSSLTDLLTVKQNEETAQYYYGIKLCNANTGYEDTLVLKGKDIADLNYVTVYPKEVEGLVNNI